MREPELTRVFVAGSGGHLAQMFTIAGAEHEDGDFWISDRTKQSESLFSGLTHRFVPYTSPRNICAVIVNVRNLLAIMPRETTVAYSTGARIAISMAIACLIRGVQFTYIESATRVSHRSLTGRVLAWFPWVRRFVQHKQLANHRWRYVGSVLDGYRRVDQGAAPFDTSQLNVLVMVGLSRGLGFRRMIEAVASALPDDANVTWQYGSTDISGLDLPGRAESTIPNAELANILAISNVVVSHAGTGSVLSAMSTGHMPIVIPRDGRSGEHVDDHQSQLATELASRGLVLVRTCAQLTTADLLTAAAARIERPGRPVLLSAFEAYRERG